MLGLNFAEKRDAQLLRTELCERMAPVREGLRVLSFSPPNFRGAREVVCQTKRKLFNCFPLPTKASCFTWDAYDKMHDEERRKIHLFRKNECVAVATWHKPSPHSQEQRQLLASLRTLFSCQVISSICQHSTTANDFQVQLAQASPSAPIGALHLVRIP